MFRQSLRTSSMRRRKMNYVEIFFVIITVLCSTLNGKELVISISRTEHQPFVDGCLDDQVWTDVTPITGFTQYHPVEGIAPSEPTELYIAYDAEHFYLAFKCYDSHMDQVRATLSPRESWDNDDCVGFAFDTYNSEREAFLFNVNPYGIPSDFIWHHDGYIDNGWDADVRSKGRMFEDCYCIEIAVPFRALRMPAKDDQEWGFYALRSIKHKGEMDIWPPRTHEIPNLLAQASLLRGIRGVKAGRNLALLPYLFSSYVPNGTTNRRALDAGVDFKCSVTSNLMFDATLNPDYSQIEADPDRIELTERYASLLPEKRPFFTEGTDVFASHQSLFYSRTIRNPLAGLKLTGKIGGNRIALLSALDDEVDSDKENYYNHLRIRTDILDESSIGLLITNKDTPSDATYNRVISADNLLRFGQIYSLRSQVTGTVTKARDDLSRALGYNLNFERLGAHSYHNIWYQDFPQEFEAQSGSMWEFVGYRELGAQNTYFFRSPVEPLNEFDVHAGLKGRFDHHGESLEEYFWGSAEASLDKLWTELSYVRNHEKVDGIDYKYSGFEWELWTSPVRSLEYYSSLYLGGAAHYERELTGWKYGLVCGVTVKPIPRVTYYLNISREDFYYEYGGNRCELQTVVWNKLSYQVIPAMFVRGIYQYNSLFKASDASVLFAFEYSPLSNIYLGANFRDFSAFTEIGEYVEAFGKITYLWRF